MEVPGKRAASIGGACRSVPNVFEYGAPHGVLCRSGSQWASLMGLNPCHAGRVTADQTPYRGAMDMHSKLGRGRGRPARL